MLSYRTVGDYGDVKVLPAIKTVEPERILQTADLGYTTVGENRIKEAKQKIKQMGGRASELEWHYIGHMQSNKVNS